LEEAHSDDSGVKYLVAKTAGVSAVIAAFVATHVATVAGLWFNAARLPTFNFPLLNGFLVFGFTGASGDVTFVVGGVIHYIDGVLWGLIFALIIHPMLGRFIKPLAPLTPTVNLVKGLIWGVVLWIISSALWMPLLIGGQLGIPVGWFLTSFGPYGVQALFANLLWHSIYGVNLGLLFSPRPASGASRMVRMRAVPATMR
jgi:hypothetical protein